MKDGEMGGSWILTNNNKDKIIQNILYHKNWKKNTAKGAEAITLLELISVLKHRGRDIESGKLSIAVDNRKVYRGITEQIKKASTHTQDAGVEIAQIRRLLKEIKFEINFKLVRGYRAPTGTLQQKPYEHLIRMCDEKAWLAQEGSRHQITPTNIRYLGY